MKKIIALSALALCALQLLGQGTAIRNATIIDVKTGKALSNHSVIIYDKKITWVGADKKIAITDEKVVDGTGMFLMPGLVDSHIHFFQSGGLYTRPDILDFRSKRPYEQELQFGLNNQQDYMKRYVRLGITTVVDVGGPFSNFTIRDSVSKTTLSPNILVTGPLFSMVAVPELGNIDPPIVKVSSRVSIDSLFNKMLPFKPDFIKVWYIVDAEHPADKSFPLVQYIGQLCKKNNLTLAVHATELKAARLAVDAGANILVHSVEDDVIPTDFAQTLKDKNVTYIPTLIVNQKYFNFFAGKLAPNNQDLQWANAFAYGTLWDVESMNESQLPGVMRKWRKDGIPKSFKKYDSLPRINLVKLSHAGVKIAVGTDAGNIGTFHASSYLQEAHAMQEAGLSAAEVLKAATINAANGFGLGSKEGSIEVNKNANLLLLTKNPLENVDNLNSIAFVMAHGQLIKVDTLIEETPEAVVQRQLNAYNARNMDLFLATYADDIELYQNGKMIVRGHDQMRKEYDRLFKDATNLYCQIEQRILINNKVIDKEKVRAGTRTLYGVAVYEVEKGKIKKVTFVE